MPAKFDLTLGLQEVGGQIVGGVEYATALFERSTIARYTGYLGAVLRGMVAADGRQTVDQLALLSAAERRQVVEEWNQTAAAYPSEQCVHELFEAQVARTPDAVAVIYEEQQLTYAELNSRANQLAHYLRRVHGVGPEVRVALCLERSLELVVAILGVLKAGGAYVPLDPAYPTERLRFMLEDSAPAIVLTRGSCAPRPICRMLRGCRCWCCDVSVRQPGGRRSDYASLARPRSALAEIWRIVIYTSGSTGAPKGVMFTHARRVHLLAWTQRCSLDAGGLAVTAAGTSVCFDLSVSEMFVAVDDWRGGHRSACRQMRTRS